MAARAIHYLSQGAVAPFGPANRAATHDESLEYELFGDQRGAFTGACGSLAELIQEAEGGTLYLDEVDSMPAQVQVRLLRFLQDREYRPIRTTNALRADVRVLAATNTNLEEAVA